jgi:hypothetical protein
LYRTSPTPETAHTGKNQTEDPVLRQRKPLFSSLLEHDQEKWVPVILKNRA